MGLIVQTAGLVEPEIEDFGVPEYYATGWVMDIGAEVVSAVAYIERTEGRRVRCQAVARLHMPRSQWHQALDRTLAMLGAGRGH